MNRTQRRAAQHKRTMRNPARWQADPTTALALIAHRTPMAGEHAAACSNEVRLAWHHLCHGSGTTAHFDAVATAMNVCLVRAETIGADAVEVAIRAQGAMVAMQQRYLRCARLGPDADALAHVPIALDLYDQLLQLSSPLQMRNALAESLDRIAAGHTLTPRQPEHAA